MITDQSDNDYDEPISIAGAAKTAGTAARDTAQKYLDAAGMKVDLRDVEENPFCSLGIAAGAGARGLNGSSHRHRSRNMKPGVRRKNEGR